MRNLKFVAILFITAYSGLLYADEGGTEPEVDSNTAESKVDREPPPESKKPATDNKENETVIKMLHSETIVSRGRRSSVWSDNSIICKNLKRTDSRFKQERCMSAAQWEFLRKETREYLHSSLR